VYVERTPGYSGMRVNRHSRERLRLVRCDRSLRSNNETCCWRTIGKQLRHEAIRFRNALHFDGGRVDG
jgi:hypothetical protein